MAHLLGSEFIIAHLRSDVLDLQATLKDIISRTSRCNVMSWKFPDRLACDIDVPALLEQYEFSDDVEGNQVSHIVLLELVIDRFYLLSHCLTRYLDLSIATTQNTQASGGAPTTSVGITVLKHWNKVMQINALLTQLTNDLKMNRKKLKESEPEGEGSRRSSLHSFGSNPSINTLTASVSSLKSLSGSQKPPLPPVSASKSVDGFSQETTFKGIQTVETAFAPCQSCYEVQNCLKDVSKTVIQQCQKESLPTNLMKFMSGLRDIDTDVLDINELNRWKNELKRDLQRIQKHYDSITEQNKKLRANVASLDSQKETLQSQVDNFEADIQKEVDKHRIAIREQELKMQNLQVDQRAKIQRFESINKGLLTEKNELEKSVRSLKQSINEQKVMLNILERLKVALKDEGSPEYTDMEVCILNLRAKIKDLEADRNKKEEQLQAENAKVSTLGKHVQNLQTKQERLLARVTELSSKSDELQERLDQAEDEIEDLNDKVKSYQSENLKKDMELKEQKLLVETTTGERETLMKQIIQLERDLKDAEEITEKVKQEQRLLIEYPDLNGPVNQEAKENASVMEQMQMQVVANEARIRLLAEQTENLKLTLTKLAALDTSQLPVYQEFPNAESQRTPSRAWPEESEVPSQPSGEQPVRLWQLPPRPDVQAPVRQPRHPAPRPASGFSRPSSVASSGPSTVRAYRHNKRSESPSGAGRTSPLIQWSHGSHSPKKPPIFVCEHCGRSYKSKNELLMHSSYCGR